MRISKSIVLIMLLISLLSIAVLSQINQATTISFNDNRICNTASYNEIQDVYGNCVYYNNYTTCLNTSGLNTACLLSQNQWNFTCKTGEFTFIRNTTECTYPKKFTIDINNGIAAKKYDIDFSSWGACIHEMQNRCLIVTCQSIYDGANDGQFHGCKSGTSCQRFEICDNSIRAFYKNSKEDFVEQDPTFHLDKLIIKEVGQ